MKVTPNNIVLVVCAFLSILLFPLLGALTKYKGHLPVHFFDFPPLMLQPYDIKPGFDIYVFIILAFVCLGILALYIFPQWFGWTKTIFSNKTSHSSKRKLPFGFWFGLALHLVGLVPLCTQSGPQVLIDWGLIPLFWGFVFMQDGVVYYVNKGKSLFYSKPQILVAIGICSIGGWLIFEYLNFFIKVNWFYPEGDRIKPEQFLLYSSLGSSALLTMTLQWLLKLVKKHGLLYLFYRVECFIS
jgi:hypothetical protein